MIRSRLNGYGVTVSVADTIFFKPLASDSNKRSYVSGAILTCRPSFAPKAGLPHRRCSPPLSPPLFLAPNHSHYVHKASDIRIPQLLLLLSACQ